MCSVLCLFASENQSEYLKALQTALDEYINCCNSERHHSVKHFPLRVPMLS